MERQGQVVDAQGEPVPGATIVIVAGTVPVPEIALLADKWGRFTINLPRGRFTLRAHGPQGFVGDASVEGALSGRDIVIAIGV